jgi:hypothetical protein
LGSTSDRHALVINEAVEASQKLPRHPIIEFIAYFGSKIPPEKVKFHRRTVMDYCTTDRNFSEPAFSSNDEGNKKEANLLKEWINLFPGDISIYSYYSKAAWRSLPIIIPWTVTEDIRKFKETGVKGLQWYLRASDWRTYELHHYVLLKNCWEKKIDVDEIVAEFGRIRYGGDDNLWQNYFKNLENTISYMHVEAGPQYSKVEQMKKLLYKADQLQELLSVRMKKSLTESEQFFMDGLVIPLEYLSMDFKFFNARLNGNHCMAVKYGDKLLALIDKNKDEGIWKNRNELRNGWYLRKSIYQALSSSARKCREYKYIDTLKVDSEARPSYDYWYPVGPHQAIDGNINRRWMSAGISGVSKSWYIVKFKDRHNIAEIVIVASPQNPFRSVSIEWKDRENKWNKMKGSLLSSKEQNTIELHPSITTNAIKIWVNEVKPNTVKTPVHGYETPNQIAELYIFEGNKLLTENGQVR